MIETVEELIEVYSLDKEIKDTHPIYRDFAVKLFTIYNLMDLRMRLIYIPKDEIKSNNVNTVENKPSEVKPIENKTVENKPVRNELPDKSENLPKPINNNKAITKDNKAPAEKNTNYENENVKGNSTTNNKINERTATINIVQNAYANGRSDNENDTSSNGCSAINNININFGNNN